MIDTFSILFSTAMIVVLLVRAVKLDRALPWFQTLSGAPDDPPPGSDRAMPGHPGERAMRRPAGSAAAPGGPHPGRGSSRGPRTRAPGRDHA